MMTFGIVLIASAAFIGGFFLGSVVQSARSRDDAEQAWHAGFAHGRIVERIDAMQEEGIP